jgi:nucleoside triphosphate pyrophosphatase
MRRCADAIAFTAVTQLVCRDNAPVRLILASGSPRRADLLREAGIDFEPQPPDVDEQVAPHELPAAYVRRIAEAKGLAISGRAPGRFVLAADTTVVVDGEILGKPSGPEDAVRMLRMLSGRAHHVISGVCLLTDCEPVVATVVEVSTVEFAVLSPAEIAWYVASGESKDKAGGYAIQGLASRFVTRIEGSYSNVVGLPVAVVYRMCTEAGLLLS